MQKIETLLQRIAMEASCSDTLLRIDNVGALSKAQFLQELEASPLEIIPTNEGPISVVVEEWHPTDCSKQTTHFDLHKDGLYRPQIPDLFALYCVNPGRADTPTRVVDAMSACQALEAGGAMAVLRKCQIVYIGKDGREFPSRLIQTHPVSGKEVLNMAARGYVRPLFRGGGEPSVRDITLAVAEMYRVLEQNEVLRHQWAEGDLLLCDNYTYLHGRDACEADTNRQLFRVWLSTNRNEARSIGRRAVDQNRGIEETGFQM